MAQSGGSGIPKLDGKYRVGCADVMVEKGLTMEPSGCEQFDRYKGIFARIYYPTDEIANSRIQNPPRKEYNRSWSIITHTPTWTGRMWSSLIFPLPPFLVKWHARLAKSEDDRGFPVVVYSHGDLGTRFDNISTCSALVSHGFVVLALEHRDMSPAWTYRCLEDGSEEQILLDIEKDEENLDYQLSQQKKRVPECKAAFELLQKIAAGNMEELHMPVGHDFDWGQFQDKLNCDAAIIAGGSTGGATALLLASEPTNPFKLVLGLDPSPEMYPLEVLSAVNVPVLTICSTELYTDTVLKDAFTTIANTCNSKTGAKDNRVVVIRESTHYNFFDESYCNNRRLVRFLGVIGRINRQLCGEIIGGLVVAYAKQHLKMACKPDSTFEATMKKHELWVENPYEKNTE